MEPEVTAEVVKPAVDSYEQHREWQRSDFAEFFTSAMTQLWNSRERLLVKGKAGYIGPFLEIYSIMYDAVPDCCAFEDELWKRSDDVLTTITGNVADLNDKEDERFCREDEEGEDVKAAKMVANAEKLMGIILELNQAPVKKEEK